MIRVSDITVYMKCPRMCYFMNMGHELMTVPTVEYVQRLLLKELALIYGQAINSRDAVSTLNSELDRLSAEIRIIYRKELEKADDSAVIEAVSGVRTMLIDICKNLPSEHFANIYESGHVLRSEKFGLTGSPDKLITIGDELVPSIIKTGTMPENGVWRSDRVQLTAYVILVEEIYNKVCARGFVEYARWGQVREVTIKRHERRKVLQLRERVKKIQEGFMPEKPGDAPCEHCGFKGICDVRSTLASKFF